MDDWVDGEIGGAGSGGGTTPTVGEKPKLEDLVGKETTFDKPTEVTDGDKSMTIPAGFKIKEGDNIDTGIVVQDKAENEFVWVPVAINDMVMCKDHQGSTITFDKTTNTFTCTPKEETSVQTHNPTKEELVGKLYATTIGNSFTVGEPNTEYDANKGLREPAIVTSSSDGKGTKYDGAEENLSRVVEGEEKTREKFLEQLQNEFYNMAKSVAKYGGFYIGRYETSDLNTTTPKVQKGETPTTKIDWYTTYKNSKEIGKEVLENGVLKTVENSNVTSGMIWGCQWDAVMNWMKDVKNTTQDGKYYIKDSTGMGWYNYNGVVNKTGEPVGENQNEVNKIWDMAGNVMERTMEADGYSYRQGRGGACNMSGGTFPVSVRHGNGSTDTTNNNVGGSRVTLYINLQTEE